MKSKITIDNVLIHLTTNKDAGQIHLIVNGTTLVPYINNSQNVLSLHGIGRRRLPDRQILIMRDPHTIHIGSRQTEHHRMINTTTIPLRLNNVTSMNDLSLMKTCTGHLTAY